MYAISEHLGKCLLLCLYLHLYPQASVTTVISAKGRLWAKWVWEFSSQSQFITKTDHSKKLLRCSIGPDSTVSASEGVSSQVGLFQIEDMLGGSEGRGLSGVGEPQLGSLRWCWWICIFSEDAYIWNYKYSKIYLSIYSKLFLSCPLKFSMAGSKVCSKVLLNIPYVMPLFLVSTNNT